MSLSRLVQKIMGCEESKYGCVVATNLSAEQLRTTNIPDSYLYHIWIEFASQTGREYGLYHSRTPYKDASSISVLLVGLKFVDVSDFGDVEKTIAKIVGGNLGRLIKDVEEEFEDRECGLGRVIDVQRKPTQATIAGFVDAYFENFRDVKIMGVIYKNVPKSVYENSLLPKLPEENIIISQDLP